MTLVKDKKKITKASKQRQALHHKKGSKYMKPYWPYIPIVLIFVIGFSVNVWLPKKSGEVLGVQSNYSLQSLLQDTNNQRQLHGISPLTMNTQLDNAAQSKAEDMVQKNFWSHDTPGGRTPWNFIEASGYNYQIAGENLAYGFNNASDTIAAWMASPVHRANILDSSYSNVGFGVADSSNFVGSGPAVVVVAIYAAPVAGTATTINFSVKNHGQVLGSSSNPTSSSIQATNVSRLAVLDGTSLPIAFFALTFITGVITCWFVIRHGRRIKKILIDGERFLFKHYLLDIFLAIVIVLGFILTRTMGVIL